MPIPRKMYNIPSVVLFRMGSFVNNDIKGELYNRYASDHKEILGAKALMDGIVDFINGINFPEPTVRYREFIHSDSEYETYDKEKPLYNIEELGVNEGGIADFYILIESRNHANWQGMIYYVEHEETVSFQSEVELIAYIVKKSKETMK